MKPKTFFTTSLLLGAIFFLLPSSINAQNAYPPFQCYTPCNSDKVVTTAESRPAPVEPCDEGKGFFTSSCATTFEVIKKFKYPKHERAGFTRTWKAIIYIDLSQASVPFLGKNELENSAEYVNDYFERTRFYRDFSSLEQQVKHESILTHLGTTLPGYLDRLRRSKVAWQSANWMHNWRITDGIESVLLSEYQDHLPPPYNENVQFDTPEFYEWQNSQWGRLWTSIPLVTREDGWAWIRPYAGLREGLPYEQEHFEIKNADLDPAWPERGVRISVPHAPRLLFLFEAYSRYFVYNDAYQEVIEPPEGKVFPEKSFCSLNSPLITAPEINQEPSTSKILQAQTVSSVLPPKTSIPACGASGSFDDKPNDPLCCANPPCDPNTTSIIAELVATDYIENEYYQDCHYVAASCSECFSSACGQTGLCPQDSCQQNAICQNSSDCQWKVIDGTCKKTHPHCEGDLEFEASREIAIETLWDYFRPAWTWLCQKEPSPTFPLYWGFMRNFYPLGSDDPNHPCNKYQGDAGATKIIYRCQGCDQITPNVGTLYLPYIGGIDSAVQEMRNLPLPFEYHNY